MLGSTSVGWLADINQLLAKITKGQIIIAGALMTLIYALVSMGSYHPDEHYQILEFASMKLFGTPTVDELPWEYGLQMRSGFMPMVAFGICKALVMMDIYTPWRAITILHLLAGGLSFYSIIYFAKVATGGFLSAVQGKVFLILSLLLWFMLYLHVRFCPETIASAMMLIVVAHTMRYSKEQRPKMWRHGVTIGLMVGLIFIVRYQAAIALAGYGAWLLAYDRRVKMIAAMAVASLVVCGLGVLFDRWLYGEWTFVVCNYFFNNIQISDIEASKINYFGVHSWHYYITSSISSGRVIFGLVPMVATVIFVALKPRNMITWMVVPYILFHHLLSHKELRFLFPIFVFLPYMIVVAFGYLPERWRKSQSMSISMWLVVAMNIGAIIYYIAKPDLDIELFRRVGRYCKSEQRVAVIDRTERGPGYYGLIERVLGYERDIAKYFFLPLNAQHVIVKDDKDLGAKVQELSKGGYHVVVLAPFGQFAAADSLGFEAVALDRHYRKTKNKVQLYRYNAIKMQLL